MTTIKAAILPVSAFQQNCAILWEESSKRAAIFDPGGDVPRILESIAELEVIVEQIVLTHGHIDHAGGAAELKEALDDQRGAPVPVIGPDLRDRFLLEGLAEQGRMFGLTGARAVTPDRWLEEGEEITIGDQRFDILHCPGHTPGHLIFVHEPGRFAVMGDVLFKGSIGRTDFPYGDHEALIDAIQKKVIPLGDDLAFICGHGPGSTIGAERASNPFIQTAR
ncbi:MAG: MBL fold metallo-hydrolase [Pseudomonadota bacterium]